MKKIKQMFVALSLITLGLGMAQTGYAQDVPEDVTVSSITAKYAQDLPEGSTISGKYDMNLLPGVTKTSLDIYDLHMLVLWVCVVIAIVVFGVMFYSIYYHRKSQGHVAEQFHESTTIEILWTIIPTVILIGLAIPATKVMIDMDTIAEEKPSVTASIEETLLLDKKPELSATDAEPLSIKVTGWQWKWEYEYLDNGVHFFSSLDEASNKARQPKSGIDPRSVPHYLLNVDNALVIPINRRVRFVFTAGDVIHSWWVPDLGWKKDTIPGFINEAWTNVPKAGIYRGQCAELCGKDHGFMPIVVIAMEQADYDNWVKDQQALAEIKKGEANKEWSTEELMAKGETVYQNNCSSCHMPSGEGLAGTFPAITASPLVTGDINGQIDLMLKGKGMMPGFAQMLSPVDFAAVVTYTRNALGNQVGDFVQPSKIKSLTENLPVEDEDDDDDE